jgi:hypothetical protein
MLHDHLFSSYFPYFFFGGGKSCLSRRFAGFGSYPDFVCLLWIGKGDFLDEN